MQQKKELLKSAIVSLEHDIRKLAAIMGFKDKPLPLDNITAHSIYYSLWKPQDGARKAALTAGMTKTTALRLPTKGGLQYEHYYYCDYHRYRGSCRHLHHHRLCR